MRTSNPLPKDMAIEKDPESCRRCSSFPATLVVRTEPLCRECCMKYVRTKVIKRMETFRTRHSQPGQTRNLLLPLSMGISSISLLHILDDHLQNQKRKTGRTGFSLMILHVDYTTGLQTDVQEKIEALKKRYPDHSYFHVKPGDFFRQEQAGNSETLRNGDDGLDAQQSVEKLLSHIVSATSRADIVAILRMRLIVRFAIENNCEGILWGDSTTKLAEKVLAETAKGRGFGLPWQVADGMSPYGIAMFYPLRDVLRKEVVSYAQLMEPPLGLLVPQSDNQATTVPPSARNATIDVLMKQYFDSVEESYPSIVSNVVRTTGKLQMPAFRADSVCRLCKLPVTERDPPGHGVALANNGDNEDGLNRGLCYGCALIMPAECIEFLPP